MNLQEIVPVPVLGESPVQSWAYYDKDWGWRVPRVYDYGYAHGAVVEALNALPTETYQGIVLVVGGYDAIESAALAAGGAIVNTMSAGNYIVTRTLALETALAEEAAKEAAQAAEHVRKLAAEAAAERAEARRLDGVRRQCEKIIKAYTGTRLYGAFRRAGVSVEDAKALGF